MGSLFSVHEKIRTRTSMHGEAMLDNRLGVFVLLRCELCGSEMMA